MLLLGPLEEEHSGNNSGRALFLFRNLVSYQYRLGHPPHLEVDEYF